MLDDTISIRVPKYLKSKLEHTAKSYKVSLGVLSRWIFEHYYSQDLISKLGPKFTQDDDNIHDLTQGGTIEP
jgi:hypothetical protein